MCARSTLGWASRGFRVRSGHRDTYASAGVWCTLGPNQSEYVAAVAPQCGWKGTLVEFNITVTRTFTHIQLGCPKLLFRLRADSPYFLEFLVETCITIVMQFWGVPWTPTCDSLILPCTSGNPGIPGILESWNPMQGTLGRPDTHDVIVKPPVARVSGPLCARARSAARNRRASRLRPLYR